MPIETNIASAKPGTRSLKTTIPQVVVEYLGLTDTDRLEWQLGTRNNETVVLVRRLQDIVDEPKNFDQDTTLIKQRQSGGRRNN